MDFPSFEDVKNYFDLGLWTIEMVASAVMCGKITADQYKEITGKKYTASK